MSTGARLSGDSPGPQRPLTSALVVSYHRCNLTSAASEWARWYDDDLLPAIVDGDPGGPWVATRWAVTPAPAPGMPGIGFDHVTIYELGAVDLGVALRHLAERYRSLRAAGSFHPNHTILATDVLVAHGRWAAKAEPSAGSHSAVLANVTCADPTRLGEWDRWYDEVHVPDMLASGAFAAATRWSRRPPVPVGANHVTLYEVTLPLEEAVSRSAAAMPGIVAAGRKHPGHAGGLTVTLQATGRWAGVGYRAR